VRERTGSREQGARSKEQGVNVLSIWQGLTTPRTMLSCGCETFQDHASIIANRSALDERVAWIMIVGSHTPIRPRYVSCIVSGYFSTHASSFPCFSTSERVGLSRYRTYRTLYFVRASFAYEGGLLLLLVSLVCSLVSQCSSEHFETS